jgi:hypothetical protein
MRRTWLWTALTALATRIKHHVVYPSRPRTLAAVLLAFTLPLLIAQGNFVQQHMFANVPVTVTGPTTVDGTHCGKVIAAGGAAAYTITVNAASTYPARCVVKIHNRDTGRGKYLSVSGLSGLLQPILWPRQYLTLISDNGSWTADPLWQRFQSAGAGVFVGPAGSCNNANDGLAATADGQLCSINTAIALLQSSFSTLGGNASITLACGFYTEAVFFAGYVPGGGDGIQINGQPGQAACSVVTGAGSAALGARDGGIIIANGFEIACSPGIDAVNASQFATIDLENMVIGICETSIIAHADDGGHITFVGTTTVSTNALVFALAGGAGSQVQLTGTIDFPAPVTIGTLLSAGNLGHILVGPTTFTHPGNLTGNPCVANHALISTNGVSIPGTQPCASAFNGGYIQ